MNTTYKMFVQMLDDKGFPYTYTSTTPIAETDAIKDVLSWGFINFGDRYFPTDKILFIRVINN